MLSMPCERHIWICHLTALSLWRETREELGKAVGDAYIPLADVPDIQKEFLRQVEEQEEKERKKKEEEEKAKDAVDDLGKSLGEVALIQSTTGQVIIIPPWLCSPHPDIYPSTCLGRVINIKNYLKSLMQKISGCNHWKPRGEHTSSAGEAWTKCETDARAGNAEEILNTRSESGSTPEKHFQIRKVQGIEQMCEQCSMDTEW